MLEKLRKLQEALVELGVARAILALPAPKTLLLEDQSSKDGGHTTLFSSIVVESEIVDVSKDLFASGFYSNAVQEAFKAVDNFVRDRTGSTDNGTSLMERVFSPKNPHLFWSDRKTRSQVNQQEGYQRIYSGAMLAIRNPTAHEWNWIDSPADAIELLAFAQHLLRMAKQASIRASSGG